MRKFTFFLIILLFGTLVSLGQITVMFVNDNSVNEANTETIYQLLEQNLGVLPYFDAVDSSRSPNYSELQSYDLIIWYCSNDEDDLYLWNDNNEDNPHLMEYLQNGGSLWLMGSGFLNARNIKPPRTYKSGTFLYDYLGVTKWSSETYTSDNGFGVPELVVKSGTPVNTITLDIINWEDPPEPMVDGCELAEGCSGIYIFGPNTYELHGEITAFYNAASQLENITFAFDPATMDAVGDMNNLLTDILRFYEEVLSGIGENNSDNNGLKIFPNPASAKINVAIELSGEVKVKLVDIVGNVLKEKITNSNSGSTLTELSVSDLPGGVYFVRIENAATIISNTIVIAR